MSWRSISAAGKTDSNWSNSDVLFTSGVFDWNSATCLNLRCECATYTNLNYECSRYRTMSSLNVINWSMMSPTYRHVNYAVTHYRANSQPNEHLFRIRTMLTVDVWVHTHVDMPYEFAELLISHIYIYIYVYIHMWKWPIIPSVPYLKNTRGNVFKRFPESQLTFAVLPVCNPSILETQLYSFQQPVSMLL